MGVKLYKTLGDRSGILNKASSVPVNRSPLPGRITPIKFPPTMFANIFPLCFLFAFSLAALHPAKRQSGVSFRDACGATGVDCKNGYCCYGGQQCIDNKPPLCRDLLLVDWTMEAVDVTSFANLLNLDQLTTLGLTLSTIPRTLTFSTSLPTYTDNPIPSRYIPPTFRPDLVPSTRTSAGAAALPTLGREVLVGGMVGAGLVFL